MRHTLAVLALAFVTLAVPPAASRQDGRGAAIRRPDAPPRPLTPRGLDNVVAFTRLLGYVRYFHPSDESAATNWDAFAVDHIAEAEAAASPRELTRALERIFRPVAPTIEVAETGRLLPSRELNAPAGAARTRRWVHKGVGIERPGTTSHTPYSSVLASAGDATPGAADAKIPFTANFVGGVTARIPLVVWADAEGKTLPRGASRRPSLPPTTSAADRSTRLAAVALAWNVFQHFYPYFDVVRADWPAVLRDSLKKAAVDTGERPFLDTLRLLVAALQDGHGHVTHPNYVDAASLPLAWEWIENQLVITAVARGEGRIRPGDTVRALDGTAVDEILRTRERFISSATPQWRRDRSVRELLRGPPGAVRLTIGTGPAGGRDVALDRTVLRERIVEPRPAPIAELRQGIFYVDLARLEDPEFNSATATLARARGVVFDVRGYPGTGPTFIRHLISGPARSAQWHVPLTVRPDREGVTFDTSGWHLTPLAPRFSGKIAFVTDGRAISYAESCLGIVEHYKLGEIIGGPTAGTNGNVNPFRVPGGYTIAWTGMKVLKHDGSRHHGVGILPTIPLQRTIRGVAEGRDELLERAIDVVSR